MKVFVVSLKRSVERRERIKKQLDNLNIPFEFIDAIDASQPNFTYSERRNDKLTKKRFGYKLLDSEIACFSTHYLAWKLCVKLNQPILVLEDNIDVSSMLSTQITALKKVSEKYHFIKLFAYFPSVFKKITPINANIFLVRYKKRISGAQGYCLTPTASKSFIANATQFIEPVDDYMEKTYLHGISTYCVSPDLVKRAQLQSTIGSKRKDKTGITLINKFYIESFRLYEQIRNLLSKSLH